MDVFLFESFCLPWNIYKNITDTAKFGFLGFFYALEILQANFSMWIKYLSNKRNV